jgi:hypothetical protein
VFARNRVKDISDFRVELEKKYGLDAKFRFIPTELNPADLVTRDVNIVEFQKKFRFWIHGPDFLSSTFVWPQRELGCLSPVNGALASNFALQGREHKSTLPTGSAVAGVPEPIFPTDKYSDLHKMIRITALVMKFVAKLRRSTQDEAEPIQKAKLYWVRYEQSISFGPEIEFLHSKGKTKPPLLVNNLNLFLDESGVLRSRGRLEKCTYLADDVRNPLLLPKTSHLTNLFIWDAHFRCKHLGLGSTLNFLRNSGIWIPAGRSVIKRVLAQCITCRKLNGRAFKYPRQTDFVGSKVNYLRPFKNVGVDYTGHFHVKLGNSFVKMYLLVLTCLSIRAIHLELVPSMSVSDFLQAFTRFCNCYGIPDAIYSDNASTFIKSAKVLGNSAFDDFNNYLQKNNMKHIRIPLYSAWVGSAWERMIRTIKGCLYKTVGRKGLDYFEFLTLLSDVQFAINSRPLTYRSSEDLREVVSPNSFLMFDVGKSLVFSGAAGTLSGAVGREELLEALVRRDDRLDKFRDLWYHEYLLSLRETGNNLYSDGWENKIKVGDIVLISSETKIKPLWELGRVVKLFRGSDGKIRSVRLVRADKSEGNYSINLLHPLELSLSSVSADEAADEAEAEVPTAVERPVRAAAVRCKQRLRHCN